MPDSDLPFEAAHLQPVHGKLLEELLRPFWLHTYVDILVVVDQSISITPASNFGISQVIALIRASQVGCMRFRVDIAQRGGAQGINPSPSPTQPKYTGFRFDMQNGGQAVIDRYEQIWCFGFDPGNFAGPDSDIDTAFTAATNAELAKLASWMKQKKGGVFATGDHDYLGASMCHRMPRVGTMRKWTNADGVPPIGGEGDPDTADRIDTLRPPSAEYQPGWPGGPLPLANSPHQEDLTVQPIQWVPWMSIPWGLFFERRRPHPVLCHPTLGPIDIMPDHAHEGLCRDTGTVPLNGTYNFDGAGDQPEYPDSIYGGAKPAPSIIAYGSTLGDPPYNFAKGPQPARSRFPMISVYDGHRAGVGRVAVDSTWHHWMDINLNQMIAENGPKWQKISRYYINLAVWLSPPGYTTRCLYLEIFASHFQYPGFQEYASKLTTRELGIAARRWLYGIFGPCWVTHVIWDIRDILRVIPIEKPKFPPDPGPCLTCPPIEVFEDMILGGLVRASMPAAEELKQIAIKGERKKIKPLESLDEVMRPGIEAAVRELGERLSREQKAKAPLIDGLQRFSMSEAGAD